MSDADFILKWTEDLKTEVLALEFVKDDIRNDFYRLTYDAAYSYYRCFLLLDIVAFIEKGKISFNIEILPFKVHVDRLQETIKNTTIRRSHINSLNRSLLIDSWSTFEFCVTTLCNGLCSKVELDKLLEHQYSEIVREIKGQVLNTTEDLKIRALTVKSHLSHVPINRKTDFLFKKSKGYNRDIAKDKEFLRFLGKLRNTLHSNFIYYGKDYEYKFGEAHFLFKNNETVVWEDPYRPAPKLFFYFVEELKEIWTEVVRTIEHPEIIQ